MARNVLLQKSEDGDVRLYDRRDQFQACYKSGQWFNELIFNDDDLEDFYLIDDENEIERILSEARIALNRPGI